MQVREFTAPSAEPIDANALIRDAAAEMREQYRARSWRATLRIGGSVERAPSEARRVALWLISAI